MENENKTMFAKAVSTNQSFGWKSIFGGVLQRHTHEDLDNQFAAGLKGHIPENNKLLEGWQKPWIFSRFLIYGIIAWLIIGIYIKSQVFDNCLAGLFVIVPASVLPIGMMIFFWEMNIPRNIPIYTIFKTVVLGGVFVSLIADLVMVVLDNSEMANDTYGYYFVIGAVEEITKLIIIAVILRKTEYCWGLNGLAIGAAVGCGFSLFENAGYILGSGSSGLVNAFMSSTMDEFFSKMNGAFEIAVSRGITEFTGHVAWASAYGAALALIKGKRKYSSKVFTESTFLIAFLSTVLLHSLWDYQFAYAEKNWDSNKQLFSLLYGKGYMSAIIITAIFIVPTYGLLLWIIRKCVRQVVMYNGSGVAYGNYQNQAATYPQSIGVTAPSDERVLQVKCVSGELVGQTYTITSGITFMLGRGSKNNIQFGDYAKGVSRTHCSISFDGDSAVITDLGSTHGTFLADGTKLTSNTEYKLQSGESFYIASDKNTFTVTVQ